MKTRTAIIIVFLLLLNSCIVKSLQPFYIKDSLSFNKTLIGKWTDQKKGEWQVESVKAEFEKDKKSGKKLSEEDLKAYQNYKEGYIMTYEKQDKSVRFIAMPFKIEKQYYLDFVPLEYDAEEVSPLALQHLISTHSLAKLDMNSEKKLTFTWLDEKEIENLFKAKKLRLKHERVGIQEDLLLTATSKELYAFLKKYQESNIKDKWQSSDYLELTKSDAKS